MKESLERIATWAKSHPLYAVLIVGGVALVAFLVYKNSPKLATLTSNGATGTGEDEGNLTGGLEGDLGAGQLESILPDYIAPYNDPAYYTGGGSGAIESSTPASYYSDPTPPISPTGRTGTPINISGLDLSVPNFSTVSTPSSGRRDPSSPGSGGPTPGHRESVISISPSAGATSGRRSSDVIKSGTASTKGPPINKNNTIISPPQMRPK